MRISTVVGRYRGVNNRALKSSAAYPVIGDGPSNIPGRRSSRLVAATRTPTSSANNRREHGIRTPPIPVSSTRSVLRGSSTDRGEHDYLSASSAARGTGQHQAGPMSHRNHAHRDPMGSVELCNSGELAAPRPGIANIRACHLVMMCFPEILPNVPRSAPAESTPSRTVRSL